MTAPTSRETLPKLLREEAARDDHRGAGLILRQAADEIERLHGLAQTSVAAEPVMWVCLVPGPAPAVAEMRIRAWTADRKRMESLRAEGLDMQALYTCPDSSTDKAPLASGEPTAQDSNAAAYGNSPREIQRRALEAMSPASSNLREGK